jgi:hypothetical protein
MLHAVYERLGSIEQRRIDGLLKREFDATMDESIIELVKMYDQTEPGQRYNELHSIFATEARELSPELEKYYERFFVDRGKVVAENEKYKEVFMELKHQADEIEHQLTDLGDQIEARKSDYETRSGQLSTNIDKFNSCADTVGCFASQYAFNVQRAGLISEQTVLNIEADAINKLIEDYNKMITNLQALGREAEKLQKNMNSQQLVN